MTCRRILTYPNSSLAKKALHVSEDEFGAGVRSIAQDLIDTLEVKGGVGLAAPQVGISKRVAIIKTDVEGWYNFENPTPCDLNKSYLVMVNPTLKPYGDEIRWQEACLSVPGYSGTVTRSEGLSVEYFDVDGNKHHFDAPWPASGAIQHECDHLEGILYLRRLNWYSRQAIEKKIKKKMKRAKEAAQLAQRELYGEPEKATKHGPGKRKKKPRVKKSGKQHGRNKKRKK